MGQGFWMSLSAWGHIMPALEKSHKSTKKTLFSSNFCITAKIITLASTFHEKIQKMGIWA